MLVTIAYIVISMTAFSVMKKLMKNQKKKPNQTMATLTPGSYIDRKKSDQYFPCCEAAMTSAMNLWLKL
jgi:hypothetical protein